MADVNNLHDLSRVNERRIATMRRMHVVETSHKPSLSKQRNLKTSSARSHESSYVLRANAQERQFENFHHPKKERMNEYTCMLFSAMTYILQVSDFHLWFDLQVH